MRGKSAPTSRTKKHHDTEQKTTKTHGNIASTAGGLSGGSAISDVNGRLKACLHARISVGGRASGGLRISDGKEFSHPDQI